MEISTLYVLEWKGEKHYFAKACDRSYFWNCHQFTHADNVKLYEVNIEDIKVEEVKPRA